MIKTGSSETAHQGSLQQLVVTDGGGCGEGGVERGNNACVGDADSSGETELSGGYEAESCVGGGDGERGREERGGSGSRCSEVER